MNKELIRKIEVVCTLVEERWGKEYGGSSVGIAGRLATEILKELDEPLPEPPSSQQKDVCPNCKETKDPCGCMRNKCIQCGKPVGNITFTVCDDCWDWDKPAPGLIDVAGDENLVTGKSSHDLADVATLHSNKSNSVEIDLASVSQLCEGEDDIAFDFHKANEIPLPFEDGYIAGKTDVEKEAEWYASLHFNEFYDKDRWTACRICFIEGVNFAQTNKSIRDRQS